MNKTDYPKISVYRHHFMGIFYSETNLELTAVRDSFYKTVSDDHPELPMLIKAGQKRREEIKLNPKTQEVKS